MSSIKSNIKYDRAVNRKLYVVYHLPRCYLITRKDRNGKMGEVCHFANIMAKLLVVVVVVVICFRSYE